MRQTYSLAELLAAFANDKAMIHCGASGNAHSITNWAEFIHDVPALQSVRLFHCGNEPEGFAYWVTFVSDKEEHFVFAGNRNETFSDLCALMAEIAKYIRDRFGVDEAMERAFTIDRKYEYADSSEMTDFVMATDWGVWNWLKFAGHVRIPFEYIEQTEMINIGGTLCSAPINPQVCYSRSKDDVIRREDSSTTENVVQFSRGDSLITLPLRIDGTQFPFYLYNCVLGGDFFDPAAEEAAE